MKIIELIESFQDLVPAMRAHYSDGSSKIFSGAKGDNHGIIFDRHYQEFGDGARLDSGFYDPQTKQYLTRAQAISLMQAPKGPLAAQPDMPKYTATWGERGHKKYMDSANLRQAQTAR
jgi:hypothetical protein